SAPCSRLSATRPTEDARRPTSAGVSLRSGSSSWMRSRSSRSEIESKERGIDEARGRVILLARVGPRRGGALFPSLAVGMALAAGIVSVDPERSAAGEAPTHDDSIAVVLRDVSRSGVLPGLRWPRFSTHRDEVEAVYLGSDWRPVWTTNGHPTA